MSQMLMDCYKSIEHSSLKMLGAAQRDDWAEVAAYERVCAVLISQLRVHAQADALLPAERGEKARIMQRILVNDAQVRSLLEPVLSRFDDDGSIPRQFIH